MQNYKSLWGVLDKNFVLCDILTYTQIISPDYISISPILLLVKQINFLCQAIGLTLYKQM